ncbi:MAG: PTS lactose/cellobiose transporter subunit IIA [Erysipelotrichaceae bacterium]|nr:PTS lactose/cellobiose transporter subunit IIA [Erysipelotrichaceae bacterium]
MKGGIVLNEKLVERTVYIIANAGDSRSCSMAAMECAKSGDFEEAHNLLTESSEALHRAHVEHTQLLTEDAKGENIQVSLLLVHASNHLSVAEVTLDFVREIIELYERR